MRRTSPSRTGVWNSMVLSVITASGSPKQLLQVEVDLQRQRLFGRARAPSGAAGTTPRPWTAARPGRSVSASATSSSQNSGLPFSTDAHDVQM